MTKDLKSEYPGGGWAFLPIFRIFLANYTLGTNFVPDVTKTSSVSYSGDGI